jgi:hypothetical protein
MSHTTCNFIVRALKNLQKKLTAVTEIELDVLTKAKDKLRGIPEKYMPDTIRHISSDWQT